ncbi:hypothetical protein GQX74_002612 [Glossina fuscipes]|nr:hypothetical protein GQX74_002612 [Glossina fuscipes]
MFNASYTNHMVGMRSKWFSRALNGPGSVRKKKARRKNGKGERLNSKETVLEGLKSLDINNRQRGMELSKDLEEHEE